MIGKKHLKYLCHLLEGGKQSEGKQSSKQEIPPAALQPSKGVQPTKQKGCLVGDTYLACQTLPHAETLGLHSPWQSHLQGSPGISAGSHHRMSPSGLLCSRGVILQVCCAVRVLVVSSDLICCIKVKINIILGWLCLLVNMNLNKTWFSVDI